MTTIRAEEIRVGDIVELESEFRTLIVETAVEHRERGVKLSGHASSDGHRLLYSWGKSYGDDLIRVDSSR